MIFVFGSNTGGRHGKGAALTALRRHGAIYGQAAGLQGQSYGIPTCNRNFGRLELEEIGYHIFDFICIAKQHHRPNPEALNFQITRIGCGLAGYKDETIAPLFQTAPKENCFFDTAWRPFLGNEFEYWGSFNSSS